MSNPYQTPADPNYMAQMDPRELHQAAHAQSDLDTGPMAQHHTIGPGAGQAAPGDLFYKVLPAATYAADVVTFNGGFSSGGVDPFTSASVGGDASATINGGIGMFEGRVFNNSGAAINLTASTQVATVPVGLRPTKTVRGLCWLDNPTVPSLRIYSLQQDGGVVVTASAGSPFNVPNGDFIHFTPVSYRVDGFKKSL